MIAVHRGGERLRGRVGDMVLQTGYTLLLQTGPHFARAHRNHPHFFLVSALHEVRAVHHDKAVISFLLLALLVGLMTSGLVPTVLVAFLVAGLMVVTRCISVAAARQSVDWQTLITIGAALDLGRALEQSGCAESFAVAMIRATQGWPPGAVLVVVYVATRALTELITNRTAAVLMFPLTISMALALGVASRPFAKAITFAAAASFLTPTGYTTNLMVYGPGGYRFMDYIRLGLPLDLVLFNGHLPHSPRLAILAPASSAGAPVIIPLQTGPGIVTTGYPMMPRSVSSANNFSTHA